MLDECCNVATFMRFLQTFYGVSYWRIVRILGFAAIALVNGLIGSAITGMHFPDSDCATLQCKVSMVLDSSRLWAWQRQVASGLVIPRVRTILYIDDILHVLNDAGHTFFDSEHILVVDPSILVLESNVGNKTVATAIHPGAWCLTLMQELGDAHLRA